MPLRFEIKRRLSARSDRVKSVDLHASEPWMLASLYSGHVHIWNYESQQLIKSFEVCDQPVRIAKFVSRKNWVVTGSDDMHVRIFNYNTLERVHQFEAHSDYIRSIAVHPTQSLILTSSDDTTIKLWNWDKQWSCSQVFEGHNHYVMMVTISPKDNNTFASASLDKTIKVWQLGAPTPNFTLEGHEKGVNCVDYFHSADKPYLISGADDFKIKVWDYQNKTCVNTLDGHGQNVTSVAFHPELPIILSGSEDGTIRVWHSSTFRLDTTLNYGFERVWAISAMPGSNNVAIGYDEGSILIKLGREEPAVSMDDSGKIVWARHSELQQANLKAIADTLETAGDGDRLPIPVKDMGSCDIYPQLIQHNSNGRFVSVCGDGEYIIYTSMALRNRDYGQALEFVWGAEASTYATREGNSTVKVYKNMKEYKSFRPDLGVEGIFGGQLLGVKTVSGLSFYDWDSLELVRRIEITPRNVFWSNSGNLVAIVADSSYFILKFDSDRQTADSLTEDGYENVFDVCGEIEEDVKTARWVGDCFIYTNSLKRLNYYVGGEVVTVAHLDRELYILGYLPEQNRLYLCDKECTVVSYSLLLSILEYQTAIMRKDFDTADQVLPNVPKDQRTRVAHFLEKQGFKPQALAVSTDPEHKFELAIQLADLEKSYELAEQLESEQKWKILSQLATAKGDLKMAEMSLKKANEYAALLLLASSVGDTNLMTQVAAGATDAGANNVAFLSLFLMGRLDECLNLLIETNRVAEAALFARSYLPSQIPRAVSLWRESLSQTNARAAEMIAEPQQHQELFPDLEQHLALEAQQKNIPGKHAAPLRQQAPPPMRPEKPKEESEDEFEDVPEEADKKSIEELEDDLAQDLDDINLGDDEFLDEDDLLA